MIGRITAMKTVLAVLTSAGIVLLSAKVIAEEGRLTEFRWRPGESGQYALQVRTRTESVLGTRKSTLVLMSDMKVLIRCVRVSDDGMMHLEISYPDFTMETSMTQSGQTSKIVTDRSGARSYVEGKLQDSATWEQLEAQGRPNLAKLFSSLIEFTVDKRGRVLDVKVPSDLVVDLPGVDVKQFFKQLVILPGMPISPGAEWSESTEREVPQGPGPLHGRVMIDETTYKYEKDEAAVGRECARIGILITSRPKQEIPNLKEFKQASDGWSLVDLENGQPVQSHLGLSQQMSGTSGGLGFEAKTTGEVNMNLVLPVGPATNPAQEETPVEKK
jgi:hypothetical protein